MLRKAFTLIELLVVIAIIAILAAILFPVFAQAKMAAKKTQSLSNSKQLNLGIQMYLADHDDVYPIGSGHCWYDPIEGGWAWDTQPYIKNLPILQDPSDPKSHLYWPSWFVGQPVVSISYAANGLIKWNGSDNESAGIMNEIQSRDENGAADSNCAGGVFNGGWFAGPSIVPASLVAHYSDTILLAGAFEKDNIFGPGTMLTDGTYWDWRTPQAMPLGTRNGQPYTVTVGTTVDTVNLDNRNGAVQVVYAGKGIFAFADGHVKTMAPVQTRPTYHYTPDAQDTDNMWNSRRP